MIKALTAMLFAMAVLGAVLTISDLIRGGPGATRCPASDYQCNYDRYLAEVSRLSEDHPDPRALAIDTPEALWRNLAAVAELPDPKSIAMLQVLNAYSPEMRHRICRDDIAMELLRRRGDEMRSPDAYRQYQILLAGLGCDEDLQESESDPALLID